MDLSEQVVVAYDGDKPIYATLTSTGRRGHRTPTGIYRVVRKKARTTMTSDEGDREIYRVANVPWTLFFHKGYAVHGTYWHDGFGSPRSHGCINMSPADAKFVYEFLGPRTRLSACQ